MDKEKRKEKFLILEEIIKPKGLNCYKLSKELEIAPSVFSDWKSGKSMPKTDKLVKICNYLSVPLSVFFE